MPKSPVYLPPPVAPATPEQLSRLNAPGFAKLCLAEEQAYVGMQIAGMYADSRLQDHYNAMFENARQDVERRRQALRRAGVPVPQVNLEAFIRLKMRIIFSRLGVTITNHEVDQSLVTQVLGEELPLAHNPST